MFLIVQAYFALCHLSECPYTFSILGSRATSPDPSTPPPPYRAAALQSVTWSSVNAHTADSLSLGF